jgi:hypothetical protein
MKSPWVLVFEKILVDELLNWHKSLFLSIAPWFLCLLVTWTVREGLGLMFVFC